MPGERISLNVLNREFMDGADKQQSNAHRCRQLAKELSSCGKDHETLVMKLENLASHMDVCYNLFLDCAGASLSIILGRLKTMSAQNGK